ncbi:MAG TPA: hypothetical protein ENI27_04145 [bacterium]|nr:hypothetical protein [bacterium]
MTEDDLEAALIAAKLKHVIDLLRMDIKGLRADMNHRDELYGFRVVELEKAREDHEDRIREATKGVTQFKVWSGFSTGGGVMGLLALLKSWLAG